MKKLIPLFILAVLLVFVRADNCESRRVFGIEHASELDTDTSNFGVNLSGADDTVQKALDTLDEVTGIGDTTETNQDDAWDVLGGTQTLITVTYQDATDDVDFVVDNNLHNYDWSSVVDGDVPNALTVTAQAGSTWSVADSITTLSVYGNGTTTSLEETTAADDSGAYLIGCFDEFANSNNTNVQAVLNDLDAAIAGGGGTTFDLIGTGTNTTATMTVGAGGVLGYTSTGIIDATRFLGVSAVDAIEFGYLDGVTSAIQTQLAAKEGTLTNSAGLASALSDETGTGNVVFSTSPTLTTPTLGNVISGAWNIADSVTVSSVYSGTTSLEESTGATDSGAYLIGVYDEFANSNATNIQDVLDDLDAAITGGGGTSFDLVSTGTNTTATMTVGSGGILNYSGTGQLNANQFLGVTSVSATEFDYLDGVTSAIQTQFSGKENTVTEGSLTDSVIVSADIKNGEILNADLNASAAIDATKIADGSVTSAEFQYLASVTSDIQTQINGKEATVTEGSLSDSVIVSADIKNDVIVDADINSSAAIDATKIADGTVTSTEFQYINSLSSNAQTQINGKEGTLTNSAGLAAALDDETGTTLAVFSNSPTLVTPVLGAVQAGSTWDNADTITALSVYTGTTSLDETTAANDSGAYIVKCFDEFDNSNGDNVQDVLDDLDAAIAAAGGGDITAVGAGYPTGGAFEDGVASQNTTTMLTWEGPTVDGNEYVILLPAADPGADINVTLPSSSGTLQLAADDDDTPDNDGEVPDAITVTAQAGSTWNLADTVTALSVYTGGTSLDETTAADDSGAYIVGCFDEFDNSDGTDVQTVLDDLDAAIAAAGGGDITAVGPGYATGGAFTDGVASTGTTMFVWEGTSVDGNEFTIIAPTDDPGSDVNITMPSSTGTLQLTADDDDTPDAGDFGAAADLDANGEVADDSHNHTTTTISGLDISDDTNLAISSPIVLTDDTLSLPVSKDIVASGTGMSGGADDVLIGSDSDVTITLTVNKDIVTTSPLNGGENDVLPGADADLTLTIDQASTSQDGVVAELATDAETFTGTDTARVVTPSNIESLFPHGTDPDVNQAGEVGRDTDDDSLRGYDTVQYVYGKKVKTITVTIPDPLYLHEADNFVIWENYTGFSFIITAIYSKSDTDNVDFTLKEMNDPHDYSDTTTIEAISITTNGTSVYYNDLTSGIDHATIENTHAIAFDNNATDDPDSISITFVGYLDADIN